MSGSRRAIRNRLDAAPDRRPARRRRVGLPAAALAATVGLLVGLTGIEGSYAFLAAQHSLDAGGSLRAGGTGLSLTGTVPAVYTSAQTASAPAALTLTNTGDVPLSASLGWAPSGGSLSASIVSLALWPNPGTSAASCATTAPGGAVTSTLAAPAIASLVPNPLAPGAVVRLCAITSIPSGQLAANAGRELTGGFTATAGFGQWTAAASAASFTQRVPEGSPPGVVLTCTGDDWTRYLSWPPLAGQQGSVQYRVWVIPNAGSGTPVLSAGAKQVHSRATGWDTTAQFGSSTFNSRFPTDGLYKLEVEQSISGGTWTPVGHAYLLSTTNSTNQPVLRCGAP